MIRVTTSNKMRVITLGQAYLQGWGDTPRRWQMGKEPYKLQSTVHTEAWLLLVKWNHFVFYASPEQQCLDALCVYFYFWYLMVCWKQPVTFYFSLDLCFCVDSPSVYVQLFLSISPFSLSLSFSFLFLGLGTPGLLEPLDFKLYALEPFYEKEVP